MILVIWYDYFTILQDFDMTEMEEFLWNSFWIAFSPKKYKTKLTVFHGYHKSSQQVQDVATIHSMTDLHWYEPHKITPFLFLDVDIHDTSTIIPTLEHGRNHGSISPQLQVLGPALESHQDQATKDMQQAGL